MSAEAIELIAPDGVILRGQHWSGGDTWAIFVHDAGKDLDCWQPLIVPLLERDYSLCTVDLRGHGISDGDWNVSTLSDDLDTVFGYVRGHGANKIAYIGAGESALPVLVDHHAHRYFAIVGLSPGPLGTFSPDDLRGSGVPKLFVFGSRGEQAEKTAQRLRSRAIGWTVLLRLPTADQGTTLLSEPWRLQVEEQIIAFLEEQRYRSVRYRNESC